MERNSAITQGANYKLIDLLKFICAFFVIGIHTRPFQAISNVADKIFFKLRCSIFLCLHRVFPCHQTAK